MEFKNIGQVVSSRLCTGCGACKYVCNNKAIKMVDIPNQGIRPITDTNKCEQCGQCVKVCPGIALSHQSFNSETITYLRQEWGPVLEVWEGYAVDSEIHFKASSGGAASALALFCIEKEGLSGVLHIGACPEAPLRNIPVFSKNKQEVLACTGSRYSPAAPCEKLNWIEEGDSPCVFIGKPCDVAALRKLQTINLTLENKVGLVISIFCAGTPSTAGTHAILDSFSVKPKEVESIRYRGYGWPGKTTVKTKSNNGQILHIAYEESWGNILSHYVQFKCKICPDSTGEFADISCGDAWYRRNNSINEKGHSLVLARTERGRQVIQAAMKSGYLHLEKSEPKIVAQSQISLLKKRRRIYGSMLVMRLLGLPVPEYSGFALRRSFANLKFKDKVRSMLGTLKRIITQAVICPLKDK